MNTLFAHIKNRNIGLSYPEIEGLLYIILNNRCNLKELIHITGIPEESLLAFLNSIKHLLSSENREKIVFSDKSREIITKIDPNDYPWRLFKPDEDLNEYEGIFKEIIERKRGRSKRELDQFYAAPKTSVQKAWVLKRKGLLDNHRIAFLGDDDLVSIACSVMGASSDITVFEIDKDIISVIEEYIKEKSINNIQIRQIDLRDSINNQNSGPYDAVITDPPYTKGGITLFLNRAIQLLGGKDKYIYLYYGSSFKTPEKILKVQEIFSRFNLVIEDKINKFTTYNGAESIGSCSSLYILKTTPQTRAVDEKNLSKSIYTYENQKEEKFPFVEHLVCKVYGVPKGIINSRSSMLKAIGELCRIHKFKVVDRKETKFKGEGMSFTFILSSSNLLVHTWPEYEAVHIDLVTCSPIYNKEALGDTLLSLLKSRNLEVRQIE